MVMGQGWVDESGQFSDSSPDALARGFAAHGAPSRELGAPRDLLAPVAVPPPASPEEIEALVAVVPRICRSAAVWAVPLLLNAARSGGITHPRRIAYVLAAAQHIAQFGQRLEEPAGAVHSSVDRPFARYEPETPLGNALGNTQPGDGARFRGRGFVPIRGRSAYATWSQRLGMPEQLVNGVPVPFFVAYPATMAQPNVAAQTLVRGMRDGLFTGVALGYYVNDKKADFAGARRVIDAEEHARDIAETARTFARAIENVHGDLHRERMQQRAIARAASGDGCDVIRDIREAVERLAARGDVLPFPLEVIEWSGEARQGKFVQLDETTCALHTGRGTYVRLDVQRDLNGIVPPEGRNMALKRSGEVRLAARHGETNFWR